MPIVPGCVEARQWADIRFADQQLALDLNDNHWRGQGWADRLESAMKAGAILQALGMAILGSAQMAQPPAGGREGIVAPGCIAMPRYSSCSSSQV